MHVSLESKLIGCLKNETLNFSKETESISSTNSYDQIWQLVAAL